MRKVTIATVFGPQTVRCFAESKGLAVTEVFDQDGLWVITHLGSGMKMGPAFKEPRSALSIIKELHALEDWTKDGPTISQRIRSDAEWAKAVRNVLRHECSNAPHEDVS